MGGRGRRGSGVKWEEEAEWQMGERRDGGVFSEEEAEGVVE